MKGVEIEAEWLVTDATRLRFDAQYLDATYDDFRYVTPLSAGPPLSGMRGDARGLREFDGGLLRASGHRMRPSGPSTWAPNRRFRCANDARIVAGRPLHYQSEILTGLDFTPLEYQDDYVYARRLGHVYNRRRPLLRHRVRQQPDRRDGRRQHLPAAVRLSSSWARCGHPACIGLRLGARF